MKYYFNIIKNLLRFHAPFLGILWIIYYIYIRLISSYITHDVQISLFSHKFFYVCLAIAFICIHLFSIKSLIESSFGFNNQQVYPFITLVINTIYWNPLLYIYNIIAPKIPYSGVFFLWITKYINKFNISTLFIDCAIIFDYIPRLLIAIFFFVDIMIYHDMFHFFAVLNYIVIPILYKIFLKLYADFAHRNYKAFEHYFIVTELSAGSYEFKPINDYILDQNLCKDWITLRDVEIIATMFQQVCTLYGKPIYLLTSICYILGWSYFLTSYLN